MTSTTNRSRSDRHGRRLRLAVIAPLLVLALGSGALVVARQWGADPHAVDVVAEPVTAVAERATLSSGTVLSAQLGYGLAVKVPPTTGMLTALPSPGDEIAVGQRLYEVDGRPVIVLRGSRPFWRDLAQGMSDGPDVQQIEQSLVDLGFGANLVVDEHFTSSTRSAIRRWQESNGLERTGVVPLGSVVAVDAPSVRVQTIDGLLGSSGTVLSYTATLLTATARLTSAQAREIAPGTPVVVTLPSGETTEATITVVDPGGVTDAAGETSPPTATIEFLDPAVVAGIGLPALKAVVAGAEVADALVVPVTALLATSDGTYAVDVIRDGETVRVPVGTGLIADTRVQIVSGGLEEGDVVVVAL